MAHCRRQTAQFDPHRINNTYPVELIVVLASEPLTTARDETHEIFGLSRQMALLDSSQMARRPDRVADPG